MGINNDMYFDREENQNKKHNENTKPQHFFLTGGALPPEFPYYIYRQDADRNAENAMLVRNKIIYIRGPRQMGKTSLLNRLAYQIKKQGWDCSYIDLAAISKKHAEWFEQLGEMIFRDCELSGKYSPLKKLNDFRTFLLDKIGLASSSNSRKFVLFLDEIEGLFELDFSNEFLMTLRNLYQQYRDRFMVAFAGCVTTQSLIKDPDTSPFNVAVEIRLDDFTEAECRKLTGNLGKLKIPLVSTVHQYIFNWTAGHPYLTQRLCEIVEDGITTKRITDISNSIVDEVVNTEFLSSDSGDVNILHIQNEIENLKRDPSKLWKRLLSGEHVNSFERSSYALNLTGAVKKTADRNFRIRNRIYEEIFIPIMKQEDKTGYQKSVSKDVQEVVQKQLNDNTTSFSWLHLTDLHLGMKEQESLWPSVKKIFFDDLQKLHSKSGPWDLVLFTGDLTNKGSKEEFQKANEILTQIWEYLNKLGSIPKFFVVPGNHDLVRPKINHPVELLRVWEKNPIVQEEFWDNPESSYRQVVSDAFENYIFWLNNQPDTPKAEELKFGIIPGDFSVTIKKDRAKLGIVGLNTSFLQLTDDDYEGKLALHVAQFQGVCKGDGPDWASMHDVCLLMTHHPPAWLNSDSRSYLKTNISDHGRFMVHLCGHLHETDYSEKADAGNESQRIWQGRSLFGLDTFGENNIGQRRHGYSAGKIELHENTGILKFWPRKAQLQGEEFNIVPDQSIKLIDGEHTRPREIELLQTYKT